MEMNTYASVVSESKNVSASLCKTRQTKMIMNNHDARINHEGLHSNGHYKLTARNNRGV